MSLKDEELQRAKDVALKVESELKEITLKHTSVKDNDTNTCKLSFAFTLKAEPNDFSSVCFRFWRRGTHCRSSFKQRQSCTPRQRR